MAHAGSGLFESDRFGTSVFEISSSWNYQLMNDIYGIVFYEPIEYV